ncbi:cyclic lactone autoinducer peptide [Anaerovirgula multivorans]|uniref:Cyclic lactone autoinducer peptide n=1 Tax=Anaerovirgula multivorans TaxID=312168 RepID=A0A239HDL1_9FIRM|nr:cyclic lactone autoinducer peptide [Anaerovirgula multivorans]SNS79526.1 cyclic lactone autoinducer peptide [Anaerovirgula multivorans]
MFKKLKTSVLSVAAMSGVSPASMWYIYEPDIPKSIKKEL